MAKRQKTKQKTKPQELNNPHDKLFKATFSMKSVILGYMIDVFPSKYGEKLDFETLERDQTSYISKDLAETYSDLVWRCRLKTGREVMISLLFEHKSYKPKRPHLQMGEYQFGAYRIQDQANPDVPLIQVIPIMVYHGQEGWAFIEPFDSYFGEIDDDFMPFLPSFDFVLTNIQSYSDNVIQAFRVRFLEKIFLAYKHFLDKAYLRQHFAEIWLLNYPSTENDETATFIHSFGVYLSAITGGITDEEIRRQLDEIESKSLNPEEIMVATERFLDNLKKEASKVARQQGLEQGLEQGQITLILDIYQKTGWSAAQIADITSFTAAYIQSVIDKHEKEEQ